MPPPTLGDASKVLLVFIVASFLGGFFGFSRTGLFVGGLFAIAAYVAASWVVAGRLADGDALAGLAFHRTKFRDWVAAAAIGVLMAVGASMILMLLPQGESPMTRTIATSGGLLSVFILALIAPWAEEFLLRGVIYGALERRGGAMLAVFGTAGIFSLLHCRHHKLCKA